MNIVVDDVFTRVDDRALRRFDRQAETVGDRLGHAKRADRNAGDLKAGIALDAVHADLAQSFLFQHFFDQHRG